MTPYPDIESFQGDYRFLSNFHPSRMTVDGYIYPTVEHAFQSMKTADDEWAARIRNAYSPGRAKAIGRMCPMRDDWMYVRDAKMTMLVYEKFRQNPDLRGLLISTGESDIYEGNTWGDVYWGVVNGSGENRLGKILMTVRSMFK